jgi:hypothetical protein
MPDGNYNISGGVMFAYGTKADDVIYDKPVGGNAIVVAWNREAGNTTYAVGSNADIFKLPDAARVAWDKRGDGTGGISASYNTTSGFIPIDEVTVTGIGVAPITHDQLQIYPNPASGELTIESSDLRVEKVEIFDIAGKTVFTSHEPTLNISQLPAGAYFVKIKTDKGEWTKKVIKEP